MRGGGVKDGTASTGEGVERIRIGRVEAAASEHGAGRWWVRGGVRVVCVCVGGGGGLSKGRVVLRSGTSLVWEI